MMTSIPATAINRRRILASGVALTATVAVSAPNIVRAATRNLALAHQWQVDHPIQTACEAIKKQVEERSNGALGIDIFPAGQLGTGKDMVQQVVDDSLDLTIDGPGIVGLHQQPLSLFDAPFVARDWEHMKRMLASDWAREQYAEAARNRNLQIFGDQWYYGRRHFTTTSTPLMKPDDVKGLKIRVPEVPHFVDMINALGGSPTPMALPDVYLSLQTGVIDGQENPLTVFESQKFSEVQDYIALTGHIINPEYAIASANMWNSLSEDERTILIEAFNAGGKINDDLIFGQEDSLATKFESEGVTITEPDVPAFQEAMAPVHAKYESVWGPGVLAELQKL